MEYDREQAYFSCFQEPYILGVGGRGEKIDT